MRHETRYYNKRRPKGTVCNKAYSIYNQCRECHGWEGDMKREVLECTASDCPLFYHRRPKSDIRKNMASNPSIYQKDEKGTPTYLPSGIMQHMGYREASLIAYDRSAAIKMFCKECMCIPKGARLKDIKECPSQECWLWPHRMGNVEVD